MQWLPMTFNVFKNIYQTNLVMKLLLPFVNQQFSVQITHFSPFIVSPAYKCEQIIFWFVCVVTFKRAGKASSDLLALPQIVLETVPVIYLSG